VDALVRKCRGVVGIHVGIHVVSLYGNAHGMWAVEANCSGVSVLRCSNRSCPDSYVCAPGEVAATATAQHAVCSQEPCMHIQSGHGGVALWGGRGRGCMIGQGSGTPRPLIFWSTKLPWRLSWHVDARWNLTVAVAVAVAVAGAALGAHGDDAELCTVWSPPFPGHKIVWLRSHRNQSRAHAAVGLGEPHLCRRPKKK
jgi:hypothetical protein